MREFFVEIFKEEGPLKITLFNIWHILYIVIILGVTIFLAIYTFKKSRDFKNKLLNIIAYIIIATYIFSIHYILVV